MHVILDCDDVLLSWKDGFAHFMRDEYGIETDPEGPHDWDMAAWLGVDAATARRRTTEFNAHRRFGGLDPVPGAVAAIEALAAAGCRMTVLTSCSDAGFVVERRRRNLHAHFGDAFSQIICLPMGMPKSSWLWVLRPGIWIEDNYGNALHGHEAGHKTFMMRRSHNRVHEPGSHPDIAWVDDWSPIVALFS